MGYNLNGAEGTPNIFNFIPSNGFNFGGGNDLAGLMALFKDNNYRDQWGENWIWVLFMMAMWGGGFGFGGGFGNRFGAYGTPEIQSAISNEFLLNAINSTSRDQINFAQNLSNSLNCDINTIQTILNQISNTLGLGQKDIINQICGSTSNILSTMQTLGCSIESAIDRCCCTTQRSIDAVNLNLTTLGYQEQLRTQEQTCALNNNMNNGFRELGTKIEAQTLAMSQGFQSIKDQMATYKVESLQAKIADQDRDLQTLRQYNSMQALINPINERLAGLECAIPPRPVPAYPVNPYGFYGYNNGCGCSQGVTNVTPA
jgi:hypothetical protein